MIVVVLGICGCTSNKNENTTSKILNKDNVSAEVIYTYFQCEEKQNKNICVLAAYITFHNLDIDSKDVQVKWNGIEKFGEADKDILNNKKYTTDYFDKVVTPNKGAIYTRQFYAVEDDMKQINILKVLEDCTFTVQYGDESLTVEANVASKTDPL